MKAYKQYVEAKKVELVDIPEPTPINNQVKIKIKWAGLCGSDVNMYAYGSPYPAHVIGHEMSGEVVELGPECTTLKVGDRVAPEPVVGCGKCPSCLSGKPNLCRLGYAPGLFDDNGAFSDFIVFPESGCHIIPENVSYESAACVEPLAVGYHTLKPANFKAGDSVVVTGAGPIGLGAIAALKAKGAKQVIVLQRKSLRQQFALEFGADIVIDPNEEDAAKKIMELTDGNGADCCIETTGAQSCFDICLAATKPAGTVCVVSMWHAPASLDMNSIVGTEIAVVGSLGYNGTDYADVLDMIARGVIDTSKFVTKKIALEDTVTEGLETMLGPDKKKMVKILVTPDKTLL